MAKKMFLFGMVALLFAATGAVSAAYRVVYPGGTKVTLTDYQGNVTNCRVGQEEGLFYPADPNSPANYADCNNKFPMRGLGVAINGLPAVCNGDTIVPNKADNCTILAH